MSSSNYLAPWTTLASKRRFAFGYFCLSSDAPRCYPRRLPYLFLRVSVKKTNAEAKVKQATPPIITPSLVHGRLSCMRRVARTKPVRIHSIPARSKTPCAIFANSGLRTNKITSNNSKESITSIILFARRKCAAIKRKLMITGRRRPAVFDRGCIRKSHGWNDDYRNNIGGVYLTLKVM